MTSATLLLLAGLTVQGAAPPQAPPTDPLARAYYLFLQSRALEGRNDVDGAAALLRQASALVPEAAELHAELAGLYARASRAAEAVAAGEGALAVDPGNVEAHRWIGLVQTAVAAQIPDRGGADAMMAQAVTHLQKAIDGGLADPNVQFTLARLRVIRGEHPQAITALKKFLLGQPGYTPAMLLLAESYNSTGQSNEAIGVLEDAVRENPDNARTSVSLAELYERAGRWSDAAAVWTRLGSDPQRGASYRLRRATALVNSGAIEAGRTLLTEMTTASPRDVSAWYLLTQVELRAGNPDAAEAAARRIPDIDPADPRGPLAMADVLSSRRDFAAVIAALEPRVTTPLPGDLENGVHARLAGALSAAYHESGSPARAVEVLEAARSRMPDDADVLYNLGAAYERAKRFDASEDVFRDLIGRDPANAGGLNYLGYMLADRGVKLDEAVALIKRALVIEPGNPSYLDSLGWAYFKQERYLEARAPLEQAALAMTTASIVQEHLGDLYFQLKRYREAAQAFDRALAGDRNGVDVAALTKKRDRARELGGR
jgi:tetratricopeptide (TPR) repeat protein